MRLPLEQIMDELRNREEGNSILEALYEFWISQDPFRDEEIHQLYKKLGAWMKRMSVADSDSLTNIIVELCVAHAKAAFLDGASMGGLLIRELLQETWQKD